LPITFLSNTIWYIKKGIQIINGIKKMFLNSIEYAQYEGTSRLWKLEDCSFSNINLIVGKNASGKSRTLNIISGLANMLSGARKLQFISGNYKVEFSNERAERVEYYLHYENRSIIKEKLLIDSLPKLERGIDGIGSIYYNKQKETLDFQTPPKELATVARRDSIQHPFLEDLYNWGRDVRYYRFGTPLGKEQLTVLVKNKDKAEQQALDLKNTSNVTAIYIEGERQYSHQFTGAILKDMNAIGFSLEDIGTHVPENIILKETLPSEPVGLFVKEIDLECETDQLEMSQGMFRALSLIIQIHYSLFTGNPSCILIDDIGEGLDFERSSALVKLLVERAKNSAIQLIMATNDRFIMNSVPLEYWLVIQRLGNICKIYSQNNSPQLFDDFKLTGLNNFDFFSSGYYLKS
jgi:ABC-type lipoprotein export system ATPase subunit